MQAAFRDFHLFKALIFMKKMDILRDSKRELYVFIDSSFNVVIFRVFIDLETVVSLLSTIESVSMKWVQIRESFWILLEFI